MDVSESVSNNKRKSIRGVVAVDNSVKSPSFRVIASAAPTVAKLINKAANAANSTSKPSARCYVCQELCSAENSSSNNNKNNNSSIECSSCSRSAHTACLELNEELVDWLCIRQQYGWQCMECKRCMECAKAHDEDQMLFCDRCDRGFHTYCVGVQTVPEGAWLCVKCEQFKARLAAVNDKISASGVSNRPYQQQHSAGNSPSSSSLASVHSKLKSRGIKNVASELASLGEERRGRGRPPGSLNKPKDPNSPSKKQIL